MIGNPVEHSISPIIHNTFFEDIKENSIYNKILVENLDKNVIDNFLKNKIKGLNITVPYKISIIKYLYDIDEQAKMIGAVNTLKYTKSGYVGYNTDINGIEDTLLENNINIKNKTVLIIGAGGSGYTASFMALKNRAKKIIIANRTLENAKSLKEHILQYYKEDKIRVVSLEDLNNIKNIDIVINTTTLGFGENINKCPLENTFFKNNNLNFVLDIIYTPFKTKLLKMAENNNVNFANGFSMLIYQALKAQEIWLNKKININDKIAFKNKIYNLIYNS